MCNHYIIKAKRNCKFTGKYNGFCKRHIPIIEEEKTEDTPKNNCHFYMKKQKRTCKFKGKYNGFCKRHMKSITEEKEETCCIELEECSICLCDIENKKMSVTICNHMFHKVCIKEWCKESNSCPICRRREPIGKEKRKRVVPPVVIRLQRIAVLPRPPPIAERPVIQDIQNIMGDLREMNLNDRLQHIMAVLQALGE